MALTEDGHVYTWALDKKSNWIASGNLDAQYTTPKIVVGLQHISDIDSSGNYIARIQHVFEPDLIGKYFVAVEDGKRIFEWGYKYNQGKGTIISVPKLTYAHSGIKAVATSGYDTIALLENKTIMGWGSNDRFQLGVTSGKNVLSTHPVITVLPNSISKILMTFFHMIAVTDNGHILFWGGCLTYDKKVIENSNGIEMAIDNVFTAITQDDDDVFPDVILKRDGTVWLVYASQSVYSDDRCGGRQVVRFPKYIIPFSGMNTPAVAIANADIGEANFTILTLGKDNTIWGANFGHPERGFKKLNIALINYKGIK